MEGLEQLIKALEKERIRDLRNLSEDLLRQGAESGDKELIKLAVISHSLSKLLEKGYYRRKRNVWKDFVVDLKNLVRGVQKGSVKIDELEKRIIELDRHFGRYVDRIINISKVRKGSTLYAWGMSLKKSSELVGAPEWEIMSQAGKTRIVDEEDLSLSVQKRFNIAKEVIE
ncbi:MAG: hypothetical protein GOU99_02580 [Candidatus Altiarchaeota archaeon]|nr:hypothetical protein [Candidatus Altiarchaeota archaeon]